MENAIYHYGVKGMRWGIRRTPAQLGHPKAIVSRKQDRHPLLDKYKLEGPKPEHPLKKLLLKQKW